MIADLPYGTAADPTELADLVAAATRIDVRRFDGERLAVIDGHQGDEPAAALRAAAAVPEPGAAGPMPAEIELCLERGDSTLGLLLIDHRLRLRLTSWSRPLPAADPERLARWLDGLGHGDPLAVLLGDAAGEGDEGAAPVPAPLQPHLPRLRGERANIGERLAAFDALAEVLGAAEAVWSLCRWLGGLGADSPHAAVACALLEAHGMSRVLLLADAGVPATAQRGFARFLVAKVTSRGFALQQRWPQALRETLLNAAPPAEREPLRLRLFGESLPPPGSRLVGAADNGRLRRVSHDGDQAVALDGSELVVLRDGHREELLTVLDPTTPLAIRGAAAWYRERRGGLRSIPLSGGEPRARLAPWLRLAPLRLRRARRQFTRARDRALQDVLRPPHRWLTLDPVEDDCDAYAHFGGELPRPLGSTTFWACDLDDAVLHRATADGQARRVALDGQPLWLGADHGAREGALLVLRRAGDLAVVAAGARGEPHIAATLTTALRPRRAFRATDGVHLLLDGPLGDVLVALPPDAAGGSAARSSEPSTHGV